MGFFMAIIEMIIRGLCCGLVFAQIANTTIMYPETGHKKLNLVVLILAIGTIICSGWFPFVLVGHTNLVNTVMLFFILSFLLFIQLLLKKLYEKKTLLQIFRTLSMFITICSFNMLVVATIMF